ncbi:hypothetical protein BE21_57585 [Sorangium cellulosum]|uniref:Uncharacterized protein n=1 Tax=Sorangium cellulosum TaxID=56 RepID=A0A150U364_SORCE|nr:hypothetical protein BE21_57585 [Sorangium cellulosum]
MSARGIKLTHRDDSLHGLVDHCAGTRDAFRAMLWMAMGQRWGRCGVCVVAKAGTDATEIHGDAACDAEIEDVAEDLAEWIAGRFASVTISPAH